MRLLPNPITFVWDQGNLDKNFIKHSVFQQEAEEIFANEPFTVTDDRKHYIITEERYFALGKKKADRKLFAAFTVRDIKIQIISIRDMIRQEKNAYEKL